MGADIGLDAILSDGQLLRQNDLLNMLVDHLIQPRIQPVQMEQRERDRQPRHKEHHAKCRGKLRSDRKPHGQRTFCKEPAPPPGSRLTNNPSPFLRGSCIGKISKLFRGSSLVRMP